MQPVNLPSSYRWELVKPAPPVGAQDVTPPIRHAEGTAYGMLAHKAKESAMIDAIAVAGARQMPLEWITVHGPARGRFRVVKRSKRTNEALLSASDYRLKSY